MVIRTISLIEQEPLFPLSVELSHVHMTWATQEGAERGSTCLVSGSNNFSCSLILEDQSTYFNLISGELFIAVNFTVANPKDDTSFQGFLPENARPSMIKVGLDTDPWSGNAFPLFPNVHLRATLAMTIRRTMAKGNLAAFGVQIVSCDAQNSPMSLIVCSASTFVIFQYRPSVSGPRPAHYG